MATKKDFTQANTGRVYDAITEATADAKPKKNEPLNPRTPYSPERVQEMRDAMTTRGRKGCKAVRVNMAFTPEVHDYIRTMAAATGQSITDFTNQVFARSMAENKELYEKAKQFKESFK